MENILGGDTLRDAFLSQFHVMDGLLSSPANSLHASSLSSFTQPRVSQMSPRPSYRQNTNGGTSSDLEEIVRRDISQDLFQKLFHMLYLRDEEITGLITTKLGYKLFKELMESGNNYQLPLIVRMITRRPERLINSLFTRNGSNSVQMLIKKIGRMAIAAEVVHAISTGFCRLMKDRTAHLVIFSCLDSTEQNELLFEEAIKHCVLLATHEKGCISLNKFITSSKGHGRSQLLHAVTNHTLDLSQDPFGNYVLQHILALSDPIFIDKICYILRGHFVRLSSHKFGSHVVEKCLMHPRTLIFVILDFVNCGRLSAVAQDQYGNYVIQRALRATKVLDYRLYIKLLKKLLENWDACHCGYGRNVIELIMEGVREISKGTEENGF